MTPTPKVWSDTPTSQPNNSRRCGMAAVHNYKEIDWTIVHTLARHHLGDFTEFAKVIASRLAR